MIPPIAAAPAFARRTDNLSSSAIRDLLAVTNRADIISLAGGLPDQAVLPTAWLAEVSAAVLTDSRALQYSTTEGEPELRASIAHDESGWCGRSVDAADVLVTAGSQQALDLLATVLLDPGDTIVVDDPAYLGALQIFRLAGARLVGIPHDRDGLRTELLEDRLRGGLRPRFVYTTPTFANPACTTTTEDRRRHLAALADHYGFRIVEDDAYRRLWFADPAPAPIATWSDRTVRLGSFSKVLAPGLRVGWAVADAPLRAMLVRAKQAADLHTSTLAQRLVAGALSERARFEAHVAQIRSLYAGRASALLGALDDVFGERIVATVPSGGMFTWARFTDGTDTGALVSNAIRSGVAFVPGSVFAVDARGHDAMRLCFTTYDADVLRTGVERLAKAVNGR